MFNIMRCSEVVIRTKIMKFELHGLLEQRSLRLNLSEIKDMVDVILVLFSVNCRNGCCLVSPSSTRHWELCQVHPGSMSATLRWENSNSRGHGSVTTVSHCSTVKSIRGRYRAEATETCSYVIHKTVPLIGKKNLSAHTWYETEPLIGGNLRQI